MVIKPTESLFLLLSSHLHPTRLNPSTVQYAVDSIAQYVLYSKTYIIFADPNDGINIMYSSACVEE